MIYLQYLEVVQKSPLDVFRIDFRIVRSYLRIIRDRTDLYVFDV